MGMSSGRRWLGAIPAGERAITAGERGQKQRENAGPAENSFDLIVRGNRRAWKGVVHSRETSGFG